MRFGARIEPGGVRFRLFAPRFARSEGAEQPVQLVLEGQSEPLPMPAIGGGWYELCTPLAHAGSLYRFRLPDGALVADPAARFQPRDVAGPSEVIDPGAYTWQQANWRGRPWSEAVLYELHVGTFTAEGTLTAAQSRLDHLAALGVTGIELMGLTDFPGTRSWGYDGVLLFAPDSAYGRPEELRAFIDAAHAHGLMVILDVVLNHFGPEGNAIASYFPEIFSAEHKTAWGSGLNFDGPGCEEVRELILDNALYWLEEFGVDGLRLDASHEMHDRSPKHILEELAERVRAFEAAQTPPRHLHLILESEDTSGRLLRRTPEGQERAYSAQWDHAIDHLLGAAMGGECSAHDPQSTHEIEEIGRALAQGFMANGGDCDGPPQPLPVPPTAFVSFIQTHDLVGNRPFGDRIHSLAETRAVRVIAAVYLLSPQIPMLFMGEEWAASTPFPYFCDFHGDLAEAVRKGRCDDMAKSGQLSEEELKRVPDPGAESTFRSAQLRWEEIGEAEHASQLDWYRRVLAARREFVVPLLRGLTAACGHYEVLSPAAVRVRWQLGQGATLEMVANLSRSNSPAFAPPEGEVFWLEGTEIAAGDGQLSLGPWSVRWSVLKRNAPAA